MWQPSRLLLIYEFYNGKKITWYVLDYIPMTDTAIGQVNTLDKDQLERLTFRYRKGRLIGEFKLTGVYG